jgi:hypothetical protein
MGRWDENKVIFYIILLIISIALFFGLLFGLIYPEIYRASYTPAQCNLYLTTINYNYLCYKNCDSCKESDVSQSCDSFISQFQSYNPKECLNGTMTQCPKQGQICGNGYKCCATSCSTCCSTRCSNGRCSTSCNPCNCYCSLSVSNSQCTTNCDIVYTSILYFKYKILNTTEIKSAYSQYFEKDLKAATDFTQYYNSLKDIKCYYDPNNPYVISLNIDYTPWKWVIFAIFGIVPFMIALILSTDILLYIINTDQDLINLLNYTLWVGIIIPLIVLLPIYEYSILSSYDKQAILITAIVFIVFGIAPISVIQAKFCLEKLKSMEKSRNLKNTQEPSPPPDIPSMEMMGIPIATETSYTSSYTSSVPMEVPIAVPISSNDNIDNYEKEIACV